MRHRIRRWMEVPRGATAVEYLVILVVVAVFLLAMIELFAGGIEAQFHAVADLLREDMGKEPRHRPQDDEEHEGSSGSGYASSSGSPSSGFAGSAGAGDPKRPGQQQARGAPAEKEAATGSVGGINPLVILIALGLLLLLGYAVFGDKKN